MAIKKKEVKHRYIKARAKTWPATSELYWVHVNKMEDKKLPKSTRERSKKIVQREKASMRKRGYTFSLQMKNIPQRKKKK